MDFDAVAYLATKGLRGKPEGAGQVSYPCFLDCGESSDSRKRKLYVNRETGFYDCKVCGSFGGPYKLQVHFGDTPAKSSGDGSFNGRPDPTRLEILTVAAQTAHEMACNNERALEYLNGPRRGLSAEAILARKFGYVPKNWSLADSLNQYKRPDLESAGLFTKSGREAYSGLITIPYFQDGRCVQLRGKDIDGHYYTAAGDRARLYNVDEVRGASDVVLVEGEFDCVILQELLAKSPDPKLNGLKVCALPGVQVWPEDADGILADAKRIFIGTDPDEAGRKGANKALEKLGPRARIIEWPESVLERPLADGHELKSIDWTLLISEYGFTDSDFLNMMRESSGRRLLTLSEAGARLRSRPKTGIKTGFTEFDGWIAPGLLPGQLMIVLAKTGTGKTLFLCNVAVNNLSRPILFVSLEMTAEEVYERLVRIYRFYNPHADDATVERALGNILICDENRLSERDLEQLIDEYEYETGKRPELVMVDYLGYYARGVSGGSSYEKVSEAAMRLKAEAKKHKVVMIAPHQVNRGAQDGRPIDASDARDSGVVEETADFLVSIYRPDEALTLNGQPTGAIRMAILKSRHGNRDRVASIQMALLSLAMVDGNGRWSKQARDESFQAAQGHTYTTLMKERTAPVQKGLDE